MTDKNYIYTPLAEPTPISEQVWPEGTIPLVATSTLTYNHEPYIRDCLDGILMQKTTFPVRVVVFEDCSTDATREIVKEYQTKYPHLFVAVFAPHNTYGKPERREALKPYFEARAVAKYIALCEGDDYWIDPLKLQKQVELMEKNKDVAICFHNAIVKNYRSGHDSLFISRMKSEYTPVSLFLGKWFIPTASMVIRKELLPDSNTLPDWFKNSRGGDIALQLYLSKYGKLISINEVMSVYRIFTLGSVSNSLLLGAAKKNLKNYRTTLIRANREHFNERYKCYLLLTLIKIRLSLVKLFIKKFIK